MSMEFSPVKQVSQMSSSEISDKTNLRGQSLIFKKVFECDLSTYLTSVQSIYEEDLSLHRSQDEDLFSDEMMTSGPVESYICNKSLSLVVLSRHSLLKYP